MKLNIRRYGKVLLVKKFKKYKEEEEKMKIEYNLNGLRKFKTPCLRGICDEVVDVE